MSAIGTTPFGQEVVETAIGPTKTMVLNMGPQHPSTHGVLRILLELDGETVSEGDSGPRVFAYGY